MEFDEKPIGEQSKGFEISEYPPGYEPNEKQEEPKEKAPLQIRIKTTVFKNRKEALEELIELYKNTKDLNDSIFSEYNSLFSKFVSDSNPVCLEKGLQAIQIWCERKINLSSFSDLIEFVKSIVEKALSTGKTSIVEISYEILSILIEKGQKDDVLNALKMCFNHKNQKVQCCSIQAVLELLKRFGPRKLDHLKIFFPEIQKLCESSISSIRSLCMTFFKESFKWIGSGVKSFTDKLKKQQLDELEKIFVEYKEEEPLKPTRQSAQLEEQEFAKGNKGKTGVKLDEYEMAIAQDIFSKFNEQWADKVFALQKWSEKKELLDTLIKAASVPKLTPTNFSPVVQMCKKLLNDSNVQIQICAIKIVGLLASRIRKQFSQSAKLLSSQLIDKLKDKKQPIVDEALKTLKSYFYCVQLDELAEDLKEALSDKNAGSKINAINLLLHCIEEEKYKNAYKQFFPHIRKLLDDSQEEVRNKCIQLVGKLKGYYTDSYTQQITLNINQQKMAKIDEYAQSIQPFQQSNPSSYNNQSEIITIKNPQLKKNMSQPQIASSINNQKIQKSGQQSTSNHQIKQYQSMEIEYDNTHYQSSQISNCSLRMDISKEIENPLRKIQDSKQQSKKEGLDMLETLISQASFKIQSHGVTDLVVALKKCLSESNKTLARQFISFIAKFGEALGKDAKIFAKTLVPGIIQNLQDKQALVRIEAQNTLEKWAELIGKDQIINFIPPFLGYESLDIRVQLMNYIIKHQEFYLKSELKSFVIPILQCLTDKNKEIRALAEQILEITLQVFPISHFYDSMKDFKPAVVQQLRQVFEKYSGIKHDNSKNSQNNEGINHSYYPSSQNSYHNQKLRPEQNMQNSNAYNSRTNYHQMKQQQQVQLSAEDLKQQRMDIQNQRPWPLDCIDDEYVEELNENIKEVGIPNDLRLKMFSVDHTRVIEAAIFVKDKISTASQISDLLFKWSFSRLWKQQNIQICKIMLEMQKQVRILIFNKKATFHLFQQIFDCLKCEQYYLADFELNIILETFFLCMEIHGNSSEVLNLIVQAHERLRQISSSTKIIKYWINHLQLDQTNCELIILVLNSGLFTSELSNELGQLSKIQSISKNKNIVTELLNTYGEKVMKANGFEIQTNNYQKDKSNIMPKQDNSIVEIKQNLQKLSNKDINLKLYAIHFLNEAFQNPELIQIMVKNSDMIILEITKYLSICMKEVRQKEIQYEFLNSFHNLFIKIINTKQFFSSITLSSVQNVTETILSELILADDNKDDKNSQVFAKLLNKIMHRVLENTQINTMLCILFNLLITTRRKMQYSKLIGIIIKCFLKLSKVLKDELKVLDIDQLFIKFHEYISEFNDENQKFDDMGIKAIKSILSELADILDQPKLMQHYKILENQPIKDKYLIKMIENATSNKKISHQSPQAKVTPSNSQLDNVSQLKQRFEKIMTNQSPYIDDENLKIMKKFNTAQQNLYNQGIYLNDDTRQVEYNNNLKSNIKSNY